MSDTNPPVSQSGTVTPGHPASWTTSGVIEDGGPPIGGNLTGVGVMRAAGTAVGITTAPVTGAFNLFGFGFSAVDGNAQILLQNFSGAPVVGLEYVINGAVYPFPTGSITGSFSILSNIASLRANTSTFTEVSVLGYYSGADGGEGLFWYNAADTTSADNGGTIIVDASNRRWYRQTGQIVTSVKWFGAYGDNTHDDHAAIMAAEAAVAATAPGIVYFPPGNYRSSAAIATTTSGVRFIGSGTYATTVTFNATSTDWFTFTGTSGSQLNGCGLSDMSVTGVSVTGGRATFFTYCQNCSVERAYFSNCWDGSEWYIMNNCRMQDVNFQLVNDPSGYGVYFHAPGDGSARSDQLNLISVTVQALYSGARGFVVDGQTASFNCWNCFALGCSIGWQCNNTSVSTQYFPVFWELSNCGTDGISSIGVELNGGNYFNFIGCEISNTSGAAGQGSADTNAFVVNPDTSGSITRAVTIIGGRVGLSKQSAIVIGGRNTTIIGVRVVVGETTPNNTYPAIHVTSTGADTTIVGVTDSEFGATPSWSYGVTLDSGSVRTNIQASNFNIGSATGAVLNNSGDSNTFANNFIGPPENEPGVVNQIPVYTAAPANPGQGEMYYDSTLVTARYWNGAAWVSFP